MLSNQEIQCLTLPVFQLALEAGRAILEVYGGKDLQIERKADLSPLTLADRRAHDIIDAGLIALAPAVPVLSEEGREIPWPEREHWDELWLVDPLDGTKEFIKGNGEFTVNIGLIQNGEPVFGVVYAPVCAVAYVGICPTTAAVAGTPGDAVFPGPGAYRFVFNGAPAAAAPDISRLAQPISGAAPRDGRINIIASRSHMGLRTRAFVKQIGAAYGEVNLVHIGSSLKLCLIAEGSASIYPRNWPTMEWDTAAGHALVRAAGGEVWQAPRDGHKPVPDWPAHEPVDATAAGMGPLRYNKKSLVNPHFVARGW